MLCVHGDFHVILKHALWTVQLLMLINVVRICASVVGRVAHDAAVQCCSVCLYVVNSTS